MQPAITGDLAPCQSCEYHLSNAGNGLAAHLAAWFRDVGIASIDQAGAMETIQSLACSGAVDCPVQYQ